MIDTRFLKLLVFVNALVPLALLCWDAWERQMGADPVNHAIRTTGMLGLIFLCLSLLATPVRFLTGWTRVMATRRMLGLFAFFYLCVHFALFFGLDRGGDIGGALREMWNRKYLQVGSIAMLMLVPLAATSTNGAIRALGAKRWKRLHRLAYVATWLGVVHYYLLVKADTRQPAAFAIVVALLLLYRLVRALLKKGGGGPGSGGKDSGNTGDATPAVTAPARPA
jgi:sulfoxide reductase heme-binding subunit YedZ